MRFPELQGLEEQVTGLALLYGRPKSGCFRIVFDCGDHVIKVPYNADGIACNAREAHWQSEEIPLAACELISSPVDENFVKLLKMEKVIDAYDQRGLPDWTQSVDCCQVGYNAAGKLVAYDL